MTTTEPDERHAVSDERDGAGSAVDGTDDRRRPTVTTIAAQTAVATRPQRPTGKRSRARGRPTPTTPRRRPTPRPSKNGDGKKPKTAKKRRAASRNPITFVSNYLKQVVAELRKVIWPNRKQMVSYTTVVLVFLAFMVALIGGVDLGLAKLVTLVFG